MPEPMKHHRLVLNTAFIQYIPLAVINTSCAAPKNRILMRLFYAHPH